MTTTVAPAAPSFPALNHLHCGKLASSSRVAIATINAANWLCVYGVCNVTSLILQEAPESTVKGILGLGAGYLGDVKNTTASRNQDLFVVGKRSRVDGVFAFNETAGGADANANAGSVDEGVSITRHIFDGGSGSTSLMFATMVGYYGYSMTAISWPDYYSTSGQIATARSSTQPIVSVFEDDAIADATDGGCIGDAVDIIKRSWEQQTRCVFSVRQKFVATTGQHSTWTNLIGHVSGATNYRVTCKGRQLYDGDTTSYLHVYRKTGSNGLQFEISSNKDYITLSTGLSTDASTILIDCVNDDSIRIAFRNTTASNKTFYGLSLMEWYSSGVE